ncbi:putative mucus binding protein [Apilactobacillus kunkeei DSM 12361 = ATCC 700308]|nr:putative mucus binding protein [Apilactobacillus kunkeei DSM 12361 = ATCC 700308]
MYNRKNIKKNYDKKILRKVKKNWIIMSVASFTFIGAATIIQFTTINASANDTVVTQDNSNQQKEAGISTQQEYADYTRYIDYQESYSNLSTSGKTLSPQKVDSVHYIRTKVMNSSNNLIGYSSNGTNNVDISLSDPQNGWRPKDGSDGSLPDVESPSIQGYGNPSISKVNSTFTPGSGFTDTTNNPDISITNGNTGQKNAIEHVKVFYDNPSAQYRVKTQYSNLTRQIDFVENSNQATSGTHIFPTRYDSISWIRNIVLDKDGNIAGYSSSNNTNMDISKDDSNQGWRLQPGSASTIPDVYSPNDNLEEKGYASPDLSVVHSTYSPENGFTNPNNSVNVAIYDGKDKYGNVIKKNAYELVTVKYDNNRTSQKDYSNLTRQIDYVNRNDFVDDGTPFPAGYHIYPTRKDTVNYVRTRVYDVNGKLIGYSSTDVSSNVDISLSDPSQGWHVASNSPQNSIPDAVSPTIDGYTNPSYESYSSVYSPINGFSNPSNKANVVINGNPANTYEYVKVVYGRDSNIVKINSKTLTRNVKYVDENGKEISPMTTEKVNYKRAEVYSYDGKTLLGYASDLNGSKTPDISTKSDSQGWIAQDSDLKNHSVKDLTSFGYVNPNRNEITSNYTAAYGFYNPNNDSNIDIYNDNNDEDIFVIYKHKVDIVTPDNPGTPGQPINPDNPNGPKWPNGTDKDSLSKTVNQTINYVDGNGKSVHDASHDQVTFGRTATVDEVTGGVTYGDWNNASGTFSPKVSPVVPGYVLRDDNQKTIPAVTVNPSSSDSNETVTYDKVGSLVPVDTAGNPIDNGSHNTSYPNDPNDAGKVTNPVIPSIPGKTPVDKDGNPLTPGSTYPIDGTKPTEDTKITYVDNNQKAKVSYIDSTTGKTLESVDLSGQPQSTSDYRTTDTIKKYTDQGYKLVSDNYPAGGVKFNSDNKEQDFTVTLEHKVDTVTPDNPGTPGQPINPDNPNGPKWPNGTDKDSLSKTVTRTINYVDQNGNKIHPSTTQTVTFTRYATVDEVTGEVVYGNWTSKESSWKSFNTPLVSGYKLVDGKQSIINSVNLSPDSIDEKIDVVYKKDEHKNNPLIPGGKSKINYQNGNSFKKDHNKNDKKLPQTGVSDENNIRILGLLLTIVSLFLGLFGIKRKR